MEHGLLRNELLKAQNWFKKREKKEKERKDNENGKERIEKDSLKIWIEEGRKEVLDLDWLEG